MVSNLVELVGYLAVLGFLYILWPPAALLGAGILLILWANVRSSKGRAAAAIGAALRAARGAYTKTEDGDNVRRIA